MYGMAGYAHMGAPVDMVRGGHGLGLPDYDTDGSSVDTKSGNSILDWINAGLNIGKTVVDTIQNKGTTVPVLRPAPVQQAGVLGMSTSTLITVGAVVLVGTLLLNRKRR